MFGSYSNERLAVFESLNKQYGDWTGGEPWTLNPALLRFRCGESLENLKVPYIIGTTDDTCIEEAIREIVTLLKQRYEKPSAGRKTKTKVAISAKLKADKKIKLGPRNYKIQMFNEDSLERKLASSILLSSPRMDSAILGVWLGPNGAGQKLLVWVMDLMEKALLDEAENETGERTSYLVLIAIINSIRRKKEIIRELRVKGLSYERLDLVTGFVLHMVLKYALDALPARLKESEGKKGRGTADLSPLAEAVLKTAVSPRTFLLIPSSLLSGSFNPYGLRNEVVELLAPLLGDLKTDVSPKQFILESVDRIRKDQTIAETLRNHYNAAKLKELIIGYLMEFDHAGAASHKILYDLYREDRHTALQDPENIEALEQCLEELKTKYPKNRKMVRRISAFEEFISISRVTWLGGWLKKRKGQFSESIGSLVESYLAYRLDEHVDRFTEPMRKCLADRRGEFSQDLLAEEYNNARLYRFSTDENPIMATHTLQEEGHLFVNVADITRRALESNERGMAEFLRASLYEPLTEAASRYGAGKGVVALEDDGVRLNGLSADAAVLSGGIARLVSLAREMESIIINCRNALTMKFQVHMGVEPGNDTPGAGGGGQGGAIDEPLDPSQLAAAPSKSDKTQELKRATEAGVFISYGPKAETTIVEPKKNFCGTTKVIVSKKVCEAIDGTQRDPVAIAKLENLLETERAQRKNQEIRYPFATYIGKVYSLVAPFELGYMLEQLQVEPKQVDMKWLNERMLKSLSSGRTDMKSDEEPTLFNFFKMSTVMYNNGCAISDTALRAYMKKTKGEKFFFKKILWAREMHSSIKNSFLFPADPLEFMVGTDGSDKIDKMEIFYKCGEVVLGAADGGASDMPVVFYEILKGDGELHRLLFKHHFAKWLKEATGGKKR